MKKRFLTTAACLLVGSLGCNSSDTTTEAPKATPAENQTAAGHGHDHADGEDHTDHSVQGHVHGVGPHEGTIADWGGGKYHVEFTVDHDKQQATVYVLESDETTPAPIDAESIELSIVDPEMQVTLAAAPQEGDPEGKASRFIGTHEKLGVVQEYAGTMTGVVQGTPYSGDFREEAHGNHEH